MMTSTVLESDSVLSRGGAWVHAQALCESDSVGAGTRIWAFAHVMKSAVIGRECNIGDQVFVESGAVIGNRVTVKNGTLIWNGVIIEDDAFIGPGVIFTNDRHPRSPRSAVARERYSREDNWLATTHVRRGASIGAGAVIVPGMVIGEFAMVGAASLVTRNVTAHRLVLGNPAREAGWVCQCGQPLRKTLRCPDCDRSYRLAGNVLNAEAVRA